MQLGRMGRIDEPRWNGGGKEGHAVADRVGWGGNGCGNEGNVLWRFFKIVLFFQMVCGWNFDELVHT